MWHLPESADSRGHDQHRQVRFTGEFIQGHLALSEWCTAVNAPVGYRMVVEMLADQLKSLGPTGKHEAVTC